MIVKALDQAIAERDAARRARDHWVATAARLDDALRRIEELKTGFGHAKQIAREARRPSS